MSQYFKIVAIQGTDKITKVTASLSFYCNLFGKAKMGDLKPTPTIKRPYKMSLLAFYGREVSPPDHVIYFS